MIVCDRAQNVTVVEYTFKKNTKTPLKTQKTTVFPVERKEKSSWGEKEKSSLEARKVKQYI